MYLLLGYLISRMMVSSEFRSLVLCNIGGPYYKFKYINMNINIQIFVVYIVVQDIMFILYVYNPHNFFYISFVDHQPTY